MKPKVRILLDVDGVLNAVPYQVHPDPDERMSFERAKCNGYIITYAKEIGDRLGALAKTPGVELIWLTTWEDSANKWIGPLFGWPEYKVLNRHSGKGWWKLNEAEKLYQEDPLPFVWIDDDLEMSWDAELWVESLGDNALAVCPATEYALTRTQLTLIEDFVKSKLENGE